MLKKLIALISSAAIAVSLFASVCVRAEEEEFTLTGKQELLLALDVISLNSYGTFDNDAEMTRADFAAVCGKIIGINPTAEADCMYFTDVTPDSWFAYTVNQLTEMGVVSGADDKLFHPERSVSLNEAVKMLVCLMGYNAYAQNNGGYPDGYMRVASEQDLLDGVGSGTVFTMGMMCELVYNALHANIMTTDYSSRVPVMSVDPDQTMLSYYQDTYEGEGIVETVYGTSITDSSVGEDGAIIGGVRFFTGDIDDVHEYLGYRIRMYYRVDENNEYTLRYIEPYRTSAVTVYSDDIEDFTGLGGRLEYYDGSRTRNGKIESNAVVIKNGSQVNSGVEEAFDVQNGEIRLIDNDDDGSSEVVLIYDFQTIVVNNYNRETSTIIDKVDPKTIIDLSSTGYISIFSDTGERLDESAITTDSVLDIATSVNHAIIYVNSGSVSGTIDSVSESEQRLTIDGTEYKYMPKVYQRYGLTSGVSGLFKTNRYGKIAYFDASGSNGSAGYVIAVDYTDEMKDKFMMKILDSAGQIAWINASSNPVIDGERTRPYLELLQNFQNQVVMYNVNSKNEISRIDSVTMGSNENESSLQKTMSLNNTGHRWMNANKMFDRNVIVNTDAVVFKVPPVSSENKDDQAYSVAALTDFVSNRVYQVEGYKTGMDSYSTILVWYEDIYYQNTRDAMIFVENVDRAVNSQGDDIYMIEGWQNGSKVNVELEYPHDVVPTRGDCIRVGVDKNNIAGVVEIHYDFERNGTGYSDEEADWHWDNVAGEPYDAINNYWNGTFNDLQGDFRLGFGYAVGVEGTLVKWSFNKDSSVVGEMIPVGADVPVIVYDVAADKFREGSVGDIMTMESYGSNCSTIIVNFSWGDPTEVFVINNRT